MQNQAIICSDNGLAPLRRQAIISTNAGSLPTWTPENKYNWNYNENTKP